MPKAGFYAVARGKAPGIYSSWADCQQAIIGYSKASYKKFSTQRDAEDFVRSNGGDTALSSLELGSRPRPADGASASRIPQAVIPVYAPSSGPESIRITAIAPYKLRAKQKTPAGKKMRPKTPFPDVPPDEEHVWQVVCATGAFSAAKDGSSSAGICVYFGSQDSRNLSERCPGSQTHNRADLISIVRALELAPYGDKPLLVKTTSDYCLKCIYEWLPKWAGRGGFKTAAGTPPKNIDLIRYLAALMALRDLRFEGLGVRLQYDSCSSAVALAREAQSLPPSTIAESHWVDSRLSVEKDMQTILDARPAQSSSGPNGRSDTPVPEDDWDDGSFSFADDASWMDGLCDY